MDEAPRLAEHYARRRYIYDDTHQNLQEDTVSFDSQVIVWNHLHSLHASHHIPNGNRVALEIPRYLESNPLGLSLVYCLESKVEGRLFPLWCIGSFFQYVPARIGRNPALDDVVSCICGIYSSQYSFNEGIYQKYATALSSLRGSLSDTSLQLESETLCASILLQMCEVSLSMHNPPARSKAQYQ